MDNILSLIEPSINLIEQGLGDDPLCRLSRAKLPLLEDNLGWRRAGADNNAIHIANIAHSVFQMKIPLNVL